MQVKIGSITLKDAKVTRFIGMDSGLPLSMIRVEAKGDLSPELQKAYIENTLVSFESEGLKNNGVLINHTSVTPEKKLITYILQERAIDVIHTKEKGERAIIIPEDVNVLDGTTFEQAQERLNKIRSAPFIRFILKKDVPNF